MKKSIIVTGGLILVGVIAIAAWVLRPPAEATEPIEAIPIAEATETVVEEPANLAEETPILPENGQPSSLATGTVVFSISQDESEVRFTLDEELRGAPTTVVGTSNQVAGEISVDFSNPLNSVIGTIQINARTLETDQNFRNRAIQNEILQTGSYEFITFVPTEVAGLPATLTEGDTITFQITGNLTIRDITQQMTFDVTATLVTTNRIEGKASATILRSDYNLLIPSVPSVANVSEEVLLEIEFVALPK
jgi:polyisoprenoid-binding protein YceI